MPDSIDLIKKETIPPLHTPFNEIYHQRLNDYEKAMIDAAENMKPWEIEAAGLRFQGNSTKSISKEVKKRLSTVSSFLDSGGCLLLLRLKKEKNEFMEGPSLAARRHWLATIIDMNLHCEPKEASRAISELNKMDKANTDNGGQSINITINSVLQRGALDG
jgi:hypothetical protein